MFSPSHGYPILLQPAFRQHSPANEQISLCSGEPIDIPAHGKPSDCRVHILTSLFYVKTNTWRSQPMGRQGQHK